MSALHGTAVSRNGQAVLVLGASGAGKSQLALQLMALGADLVSDDAVAADSAPNGVMLRCPASIKGMIEARGVGLLTVRFVETAKLAFVVDLDKTAVARLPESKMATYLGCDVPLIYGKDVPNLAAIVWCLLGGGQILPTD